jgi:serine/threonine protein kinase
MEWKVGTPGYQAPEIANGASVTPAIDMWSYGILLHELAVGYKPTSIAGVL